MKPHYTYMWIESTHHSTVRRHIVSPPGYQSPALGDSVPVPGSQRAQRVTPQPGVTTSKLSRVPQLFASAISTLRTRREADDGNRISQFISGLLEHFHPVQGYLKALVSCLGHEPCFSKITYMVTVCKYCKGLYIIVDNCAF